MSGDSTQREDRETSPPDPRPPDIQTMRVVRVQFKDAVTYADRASVKQTNESIEFYVTLASEIPIRALSPCLIVGGIPVTECKHIKGLEYRFSCYGKPAFENGAPISIAWAGSGPPIADEAERKLSRFTYRVDDEVAR